MYAAILAMFFFFQAEDGIRDYDVTGVQTCALPISKESPGETIIYEGRKFKSYRGMGSIEAMKEGSKDRYFQDVEDDINKLVPEGIVGRVPYKGELFESIHQFVGGLRAGMGYCGAKDIKTLKETGQFVKITASGINESHPHDVMITKESPNYSR